MGDKAWSVLLRLGFLKQLSGEIVPSIFWCWLLNIQLTVLCLDNNECMALEEFHVDVQE